MNFANAMAFIIAGTACIALYFQYRSLRIGEEQLSRQVHGLSEVIDGLERERVERQVAQAEERQARATALEAQDVRIGDRVVSLAGYGGSAMYHLALSVALIGQHLQQNVPLKDSAGEEVDAAIKLAAALVLTNTVITMGADAATETRSANDLRVWEQRSRVALEAFSTACRRLEAIQRSRSAAEEPS